VPIILAIVAALGAFAVWYFRLRALGQVASEVIDGAERARGAYRRKRFRAKAESSPIAAVEDPAAAASAMLIALAAPEGRLSERAEAAVKREMSAGMGLADVEEAFAFARWVADHADDPNHFSLKFAKLWRTKLTTEERADFYAMACHVAAADGSPTALQRESLVRLKDRLGLVR